MAFGKLNYINVGPHGTFRESGDLKTDPADIDAIFDHLDQTGAKKLAVHFHGGLIGENRGEAIAEKMFDLLDPQVHPVTFVWETGLLETISRNLRELYDTKLFQKIVKYAIRRVASKLGGDIFGRGPGDELSLSEIEAELAKAEGFAEFDQGARGAAGAIDETELEVIRQEMIQELEIDLDADDEILDILETEPQTTELLNRSFVDETQQEQQEKGVISTLKLAKKIAKIAYRVIKRFQRDRDHGLYPTIVEETLRELYIADFGAWVWGNMKEVGQQMWDRNTVPIDDDSHPGAYFLAKLEAHQRSHPDFEVDVIGHSAGSIAICHMLRRAEQDFGDVAVRNVLFLAPACTTELIHEEIVATPGRYNAFRMFTMKDDLESKDKLVPGVYNRSLLYFISGVLEDDADHPIAGLEAQMSAAPPYEAPHLLATARFLKSPGTDRLVLSKTTGAGSGLNSTSTSHGDFDDDPVTRQSLVDVANS